MEEGPAHFHLLVPISHPNDHAWSHGECIAHAEERLAEGLEAFRELGADVSGEVSGDHHPVGAMVAVLRERDVDEVILSTLPSGPSRWLKLDVVSRAQEKYRGPITHVIASREPAL